MCQPRIPPPAARTRGSQLSSRRARPHRTAYFNHLTLYPVAGWQLAVPHVDDLRLAERLVRAAPPPPVPLPGAEAAGSIAFLFLVKDQLDYLEVWRRFFRGADPAHYGVYVHFFDAR